MSDIIMTAINALGHSYKVPMSNGQLEPDPIQLTDDQWYAARAQVDGRCAVEIEPSLAGNLVYLQSYLKGISSTLHARCGLASRLTAAEVQVLYDYCQFAAATARRLRAIQDEDVAADMW
jgi:hypothetical protein